MCVCVCLSACLSACLPDTSADISDFKCIYVGCGDLQPFCTLPGHASIMCLPLVNQTMLNFSSTTHAFPKFMPVSIVCKCHAVRQLPRIVLVLLLKHHNKCVNTTRAGGFGVPCHTQRLAGYRLRICNNCTGDHPRKQLLLGICHTHPARHLRSCPRS